MLAGWLAGSAQAGCHGGSNHSSRPPAQSALLGRPTRRTIERWPGTAMLFSRRSSLVAFRGALAICATARPTRSWLHSACLRAAARSESESDLERRSLCWLQPAARLAGRRLTAKLKLKFRLQLEFEADFRPKPRSARLDSPPPPPSCLPANRGYKQVRATPRLLRRRRRANSSSSSSSGGSSNNNNNNNARPPE